MKDATQQPPWCLPLLVLGHTFIGGQFLAKASLSTQHTRQRLCFPACHVGDSVYQTLRLASTQMGSVHKPIRQTILAGLVNLLLLSSFSPSDNLEKPFFYLCLRRSIALIRLVSPLSIIRLLGHLDGGTQLPATFFFLLGVVTLATLGSNVKAVYS